MIEYPESWADIGTPIEPTDIEFAVQRCIQRLAVHNLSLSGGIDSTLILYIMKKSLTEPIHCYTIATDGDHPDYRYAKRAAKFFGAEFHPYVLGKQVSGEECVRTFYAWLKDKGVKDIIAGDGIDEFTCGYYSHQTDQSEQNYIAWIRRLHNEQLVPLNNNSGNVRVYLPYLSPEVIALLSLIPLFDKVDDQHRKKIVRSMARGKIPNEIIERWKFGFCDAGSRKDLR